MRRNLRKQMPVRSYKREKTALERAEFLASLGLTATITKRSDNRWEVAPCRNRPK